MKHGVARWVGALAAVVAAAAPVQPATDRTAPVRQTTMSASTMGGPANAGNALP